MAALGQVVAQFLLGGLDDLLEEDVVVQTAGGGSLTDDTAAHDVHRVVHTKHDAVVATLGGTGCNLRGELRHQGSQGQAGRVERHRVAGREGLGLHQTAIAIGTVDIAEIIVEAGHALQSERRSQSLQVVFTVGAAVDRVAFSGIKRRTRVVETMLGASHRDVADHVVEQLAGLGQRHIAIGICFVAFIEPFADNRTEGIPVGFAIVLGTINDGTLLLGVVVVHLHTIGVIGVSLVVDSHGQVIALAKHCNAGISDAAVGCSGLVIVRVGHRSPVVVELLEQYLRIGLSDVRRVGRLVVGHGGRHHSREAGGDGGNGGDPGKRTLALSEYGHCPSSSISVCIDALPLGIDRRKRRHPNA